MTVDTLAHAMQIFLYNLPSVQFRIRTSQGHVLIIPTTAFAIAEVDILTHSTTYMCKITKRPHISATHAV